MRKLMVLLVLILIIQNISALRINEIESNPAGADSGNEWVELYSEEEVDLSGYKLVNNDGDEIALEGSFSGYFVYVFEKQWLDNSDEKVFLYKNDELTDQTDLLADNNNDARSWNYCAGWQLAASTKGEKNVCEKDASEDSSDSQNETEQEGSQEQQTQGEKTETTAADETPPIITETIELNPSNPKDIKTEDESEEISEELRKSKYAVYGLIVFCILLVVLFATRKIKEKKFEKDESA